jgi:cytoskeletal protein RodZ
VAGIGIYLKQVREQQGYTLEQMNRITNIQLEYLQAIENEQFDRLPSPFYAKAFLRTYAKSLGLDAQPLLELYEKNVQMPSPVPQKQTVRSFAKYPSPSGMQGTHPTAYRQPFASTAMGRERQDQVPRQPRKKAFHQPNPLTPYPLSQNKPLVSKETVASAKEYTQPLAVRSEDMNVGRQPTTSLPPINPAEKTFVPRRIAMKANQNGEGALKKSKKSSKLALAIAIGALLLVGAGAYAYFGNGTAPTVKKEVASTVQQTMQDQNAIASPANTPILEEGDMSSNEYEGQLYNIRNVDKLQVTLKGENGESRVIYAPTANDTPTEFTLKVGQEVTLDTGGKDHIWFRLGTPSNVQITVNGQKISTEAQDTEKSYRIQIAK